MQWHTFSPWSLSRGLDELVDDDGLDALDDDCVVLLVVTLYICHVQTEMPGYCYCYTHNILDGVTGDWDGCCLLSLVCRIAGRLLAISKTA